MNFGRSKPTTTGRHRLRSDTIEQPKSAKFSYRSSRSETTTTTGRQTQSQLLKAAGKRAGNFWFQRFGLLILVAAALLSAINILTLSTNANVLQISTAPKNNLLQDPVVYETAATKILNESFWNHNKLTVNSSRLQNQLLRQFPELAGVTVTLPLLAHRPIVYVQSAQPAVIITNTTGSYVLATTGKALVKAASVASLKQPSLPVITDNSGLTLGLNQQALPSSQIAFIQEVIAQLKAKGYTVSALTLPPATSQLDVQLTGQTYTVKFNLQGSSARQQAGTFLATIGQLKKQNITPTSHLDVRVDGRAYYQ